MKRFFRVTVLTIAILAFALTQISASTIGVPEREAIAQALTRIVEREVKGAKVSVKGVRASRGRVRIYASIGLSYYPFREDNTLAMRDSISAVLPSKYRKADIELYTDKCEISELIPLAYRTDKRAKRLERFTYSPTKALVTPIDRATTPTKGLNNRHIALWQSHGRYFDHTRNTWRWQRSELWQTSEDMFTQSFVIPYLVPMLESAGAITLLPRERDTQSAEIIIDNDNPANGRYIEGGEWMDDGVGFAHLRDIYSGGENPFREGRARTSASNSATAQWSSTIDNAGRYAIYVSYKSSSESTQDALYTIHHAGGTSRFSVNQQIGGGTWIFLGYFDLTPNSGLKVTLSNASNTEGSRLSADAIKVGGGYGNIARIVCDSLRQDSLEYNYEISGFTRSSEGARYWLQWAGFDESVYAPKEGKDDYKEDYMSRAHWVNALMGGSERLSDSVGLAIPIDLALALHSDAGVRDGDETIGTLGIYYTREAKGEFEGGVDRYRSRDLTDIVMTQIVGDVRQTFEPEWNRRGLWNRAYYEARIPSAPTMLLELLSHQNFADMRYGHDPQFKFVVSRAIYKGILRYISSQYGTDYVVQPLPVKAFSTEIVGNDEVHLAWQPTIDTLEPTAAPSGYIVYTRKNGEGFDNGRYCAEPTFIAKQSPDTIYSYKVCAVNEGGESFPSETLSALISSKSDNTVIIINGFDRVSAPLSARADSLAGFYTDIDSGVADRYDISYIGTQRVFDLALARDNNDYRALGASHNEYAGEIVAGNTFDYPYLYGESLQKFGLSFASASRQSVESGAVRLAHYPAIALILGKQRKTRVGANPTVHFNTFSKALQGALRRYAASGGAIFVSGAYVVSDILSKGATQSERLFAEEVLHCTLDAQNLSQRGAVRTTSSRGGFRVAQYSFNRTPSPEIYRVEQCDALKPTNGAFPIMRYVGTSRTAAIAFDTQGARGVVLGYPFETINSEQQRDVLLEQIFDFLLQK